MSLHEGENYRVKRKDIRRASGVLVDAFRQDPFWNKALTGASTTQKKAFFESPIRYCSAYGQAYAPTENIEGIIGWVSSEFADMTFWQALRCGSLFAMTRMGTKMAKRVMKIRRAVEPLEADRKANMRGRKYLYLIIFGVAFSLQGRGLGGRLMEPLIEDSEHTGLPIYVETTNERSVTIYNKLGFHTVNRVDLPKIDLPQWGMVREPNT